MIKKHMIEGRNEIDSTIKREKNEDPKTEGHKFQKSASGFIRHKKSFFFYPTHFYG